MRELLIPGVAANMVAPGLTVQKIGIAAGQFSQAGAGSPPARWPG